MFGPRMAAGFPAGGIFMMVIGLALVILTIYALITVIRKNRRIMKTRTPLEIISDQYEKGELNKEDYVQMVKDLS